MTEFHLYMVSPEDSIFELTTSEGLPSLERCEERLKRVIVAMMELPEIYRHDQCNFFVTRGSLNYKRLHEVGSYTKLNSMEDILLWFNPNYFAVDIPF